MGRPIVLGTSDARNVVKDADVPSRSGTCGELRLRREDARTYNRFMNGLHRGRAACRAFSLVFALCGLSCFPLVRGTGAASASPTVIVAKDVASAATPSGEQILR